MSWQALEHGNPELAHYGQQRLLDSGVAYLATIRADGSPRLHPVTPIIGQGHLFVFMEPTSPKGRDLRRDGRYAMHCSVSDSSGSSGEFFVSGTAQLTDDPTMRALAIQCASFIPAERYVLFELGVANATSIAYRDGTSIRQHWQAA